jgi:hypothetical protein
MIWAIRMIGNLAIKKIGNLRHFDGQRSIAKKMRHIACLNQNLMTSYMFKSRNLHRKFRDVYNSEGVSDNTDRAYRELMNHLKNGLRQALTAQSAWGSELFQEAGGRLNVYPDPRCGVKTTVGTSEEGAEVVSLWGTSGYNEGIPSPLKSNSATFNAFNNHRTIYIQNDIPYAILKDCYKNTSITANDVKKYATSWSINKYLKGKKVDDIEWTRCWEPIRNIDRTYKSTLVTPIALNIDEIPDIEEEFTNQWGISLDLDWDHTFRGHEFKKNLFCFGYFCVDSRVVGYFDTCDIDLGYFIADMMFFYFYVYHIFTRLSRTCISYKRERGSRS